MFHILLLYAISALTLILSKSLLIYFSPLFLTSLRTLIAGSIILIYLKLKKQKLTIKKYIFSFFQIGFFSFFLSNSLKFWSFKYINTNHAAIISIFEPLFALAIGYFLFSEKLNINKFIYISTCILGALLIPFWQISNFDFYIYLSDIIFLISIISSCYGALLMRKFILAYDSILTLNCFAMLIGGVFSLTNSFIIEEIQLNLITKNFAILIMLLLIMILLSNIYAYNLYGKLVKKYSVVLISCASFLKPFFVEIYNFLFFYKSINLNIIISSIIIFIGIYLLYKEENQEHSPINIKY